MLSVNYEDRFERLFATTPIAGANVPRVITSLRRRVREYVSNGARKLYGTIGLSRGDFYDGERTSVNLRLAYRPGPHLALEGFLQHNDLTLAGDNLAADVWGARIRYAASTRFFASAFVQYLEASNELVTNLRFNFIHAPLSDVFLVLTERRSLDGGVSERVITLKGSKLLAF